MNPENINILIGCEESQTVCIAFRKRGFNAFSCDIQDCSGSHPEWHLQMDVFEAIELKKWDCMIAFPECTYLSSVQTFICRKDPIRVLKRIKASEFFMRLYISNIRHIALENPTGVISHIYRPSDQVVHPFYFGGSDFKRTCLWLKNLPLLLHSSDNNLFSDLTHQTPTPPLKTWIQKSTGKVKNMRTVSELGLSSKERSKLNPFLASAMAQQWGDYLIKNIIR